MRLLVSGNNVMRPLSACLAVLVVVCNLATALETEVVGSTTVINEAHGQFEVQQIVIGAVEKKGYGHEVKLTSHNAVLNKLLEAQQASLSQAIENELVFEPNTRKKHVIDKIEVAASSAEKISLTGDTLTVRADP